MPATDLKQLRVGQRIQDLLLVLECDQRNYGDRECIILTLGNCTGRLSTAPFWGADRAIVAEVSSGDVVQVIADVTTYKGSRQLRVDSLRLFPKQGLDWSRLQPSIGDVGPYWEALERWRNDIRAPRLRQVVGLFYDNHHFRRRYEQCPGSTGGHHAELGGLLKHTCEVIEVGLALAKVCGADQDLVAAGALLHDIGKVEGYSWQGRFETTEAGALLGHVVLGIVMLDRRVAAEKEPPCTSQELTLLHHLIASHHGKPEFGAATVPMTLEAEVLHYADNASAKTASMADAMRNPDNFPAGRLVSSKVLWQLDKRRAYRGASDWGCISKAPDKTERPPSRG